MFINKKLTLLTICTSPQTVYNYKNIKIVCSVLKICCKPLFLIYSVRNGITTVCLFFIKQTIIYSYQI